MIKVPYYSKTGEQLEPIEVDETIFGEKILYKTLHQIVIGYGRAKRQGTHSTKSRSETAYSGKKPWRQKGTGRARAGSRSSPIWRGGAVAHSIKPRDYSWQLPKKMKRAALDSAILSKLLDSEIAIIEGFDFEDENPKTKVIASLIYEILSKITGKKLDANKMKSCLLGIKEYNKQLYLSARNIAKLKIEEIRNFNAYDVIKHKYLFLTKDAFEAIIENKKQKVGK